MRTSLIAVGISAAISSSIAHATNGYFTHAVGTHTKAQAGAGIAYPTQVIDAANNPAAAAITASHTEIGVAYFAPDRGYSASSSFANGQGGAFTLTEEEVRSGKSGFVIPYFAHRWSPSESSGLSLSFYGRGGMNTTYTGGSASFDPDGPGPAAAGTYGGVFGRGATGVNLNQAFLELAYGYYGGAWQLGIAPIVAVQTFEATGLSAFSGYTRTFAASGGQNLPTSLTNNGTDFSYGFGLKLGLIAELTDWLNIGLRYQSEVNMTEFNKYSDLFANGGDFNIPASVQVGASFKLSEQIRINTDIEHTQFSDIDSVGNELALVGGCPTAGQGGTNLENCAGGNQGFGFGWSDMTTYKLGGSWTPSGADRLTFRAGYSYGEQPVQSADVLINILAPGVTEEHYTLGVEYRLPNARSLNVSVMYAPKNHVHGGNLFDPTQSITLDMDQYEIEFAYQF